jgi:hypothetical protein
MTTECKKESTKYFVGYLPVMVNWKVIDKPKTKSDTIQNLSIPTCYTFHIPLTGQGAQLGNDGDIITLLNKDG